MDFKVGDNLIFTVCYMQFLYYSASKRCNGAQLTYHQSQPYRMMKDGHSDVEFGGICRFLAGCPSSIKKVRRSGSSGEVIWHDLELK